MTATGSSWLKILCIVLLVLLLAALGLWQWGERQAEERLAEAERAAAARLTSAEAEAGLALARVASRAAESAARAFAAGIEPAVLVGDRSAVDGAIGGLLQVDEIESVHVLSAEGGVLASSDRKLVETGDAGALAEWALSVDAVASRPGAADGVTQIAVPLAGAGERVAVVVVAYRSGVLARGGTPASAGQEPLATPPRDEPAEPGDV